MNIYITLIDRSSMLSVAYGLDAWLNIEQGLNRHIELDVL